MRGRVSMVVSIFRRCADQAEQLRENLLMDECCFKEEVDDVESRVLMTEAMSRGTLRIERWLRRVDADLAKHAVVVVYSMEVGDYVCGSKDCDDHGPASSPA